MEEYPIFTECEMNILDQFTTQQMEAVIGEELFLHSFSSESNSSYPPCTSTTPRSCNNTFSWSTSNREASHGADEIERPTKQIKTSSWINAATTNQFLVNPNATSSPSIISFCKPDSPSNYQQFYGTGSFKNNLRTSTINPADVLISEGSTFINQQSHVSNGGQGSKKASDRVAPKKPSSFAQDHILAERNRREKLSQRFIALSAVVPGLKKTDKASVLGDAIKYVKQLQERVQTLEEQTAKKTMESVIFVKKSQIYDDADLSSSDENVDDFSNETLPEIEVRVYDKNMLIRIQCKKRKGLLVKILAEIEKLHLSVINTNVMPFGSSALDVTVIAQTEEDFCMTMKDLVKNLSCALNKPK